MASQGGSVAGSLLGTRSIFVSGSKASARKASRQKACTRVIQGVYAEGTYLTGGGLRPWPKQPMQPRQTHGGTFRPTSRGNAGKRQGGTTDAGERTTGRVAAIITAPGVVTTSAMFLPVAGTRSTSMTGLIACLITGMIPSQRQILSCSASAVRIPCGSHTSLAFACRP